MVSTSVDVAVTPPHLGNQEFWNSNRLVALAPGSTRWQWYERIAPQLVAAGVLRRVGKGWIGRREDIAAALQPNTTWTVR